MTTIKFYPLISGGYPIIKNIVKYATDNFFTVTSSQDCYYDYNTDTIFGIIIVSQTLTSAQQTVINNLFQGTCRIIYS